MEYDGKKHAEVQSDTEEGGCMTCPACGGKGWSLSANRWGLITGQYQCMICHGSGLFKYSNKQNK